jgi:RNA polymerase sigma-70 factor (ECF subfamily)
VELRLCHHLIAALSEAQRSTVTASRRLEGQLHRAFDEAKAERPDVQLDETTFVAHLARSMERSGTTSITDWLARGTASDLYLACACAAGEPTALVLFETQIFPVVNAALRRLDLPPATVADAKQDARVAILVGDGTRPPRIAEFTGAGALRSWVRVVAVNITQSLMRKAPRGDSATDSLLEAIPDRGDIELDFLDHQYREHFREAFREAMSQLSHRERTLLRQHYLLGLNIDQIAVIYQVHRATPARWLTRCRDKLRDATRDGLAKRLPLDASQLDRIMALIQSRLDVSVRRHLGARS